MNGIKNIIYILLVLLVGIALFALWYRATYSMGIAASYELNDPTLTKRVLIATQESRFKKDLVDNLVTQIKEQPAYIRVIDVTELDGIDPKTWTAIVVIHTWEIGEPEVHAKAFVDRAPHDRLIVVTTSGSGDQVIVGVDGISAASRIGDETSLAATIVKRIDRLLNK